MSRNRVASAIVLSLLALCFAIIGVAPVFACLWDSDTLAQEAEGKIDVVRAIVGFFPRNPPLYYEMRLERVAKELAANPDNLAAYDDAGVACDRLGRGDEAIAWMEKKRERLDALAARGKEDAEHRYRYLANVGTFWAHRWFAQGQDRERIEEMRIAADFIRQAIALNPNAHFGREKYQLMAMEWIIDPPPADDSSLGLSTEVPAFIGLHPSGFIGAITRPLPEGGLDLEEAAEGLAGLVALGNAWESPDVFQSLAIALNTSRDASLALLANLRYEELILAGKRSAWPFAKDEVFVKDGVRQAPMAINGSRSESRKEVTAKYWQLRAAADAAHAARLAYMTPRLEAGRHPDTDPDFWDDYDEPSFPRLGPGLVAQLLELLNPMNARDYLAEYLLALFGIGVAWKLLQWGWRRRRAASATSPPETRS